ncbi:MAG: dihydrodipicolinate synthase family protein [Bryobacterales bacterium]|nr:dihydrodipicolinate synthase family protein [Bryobacterales bacterium]
MKPLIHGVYAAIFTPRHDDGSLNRDVLRAESEFLMHAGVDGLVMNGATAEYPMAREAEFAEILGIISKIAGEGRFLASIGGPDMNGSIRNGRLAMEAGAKALLLPAPIFFHYGQQDIEAYARYIAGEVKAPVLLYNLPQFANGYEPETAGRLISAQGPIVGIKDSSGKLDTLRLLTKRGAEGVSRIIGNDEVFAAARREGICDGAVSGIAGALPELLLFLGRADLAVERAAFDAAAELLAELVGKLGQFPIPWGLKFIAERRGLGPMGSVLPLTEARRSQADQLGEWLEEWWTRLNAVVPLGPLAVAGCVA